MFKKKKIVYKYLTKLMKLCSLATCNSSYMYGNKKKCNYYYCDNFG